MALELANLAEWVNQEDAIRVVVLCGKGMTFSVGWETLRTGVPVEQRPRAAAAVARIEKPVLAAINGDAVGQGLELALAADIRIAVVGAQLGMPQLNKGTMPWDGGTQRLPRIIGRAKSLEMLLTGEIIDAEEAKRIGLVSYAVGIDEFSSLVDKVADQLARAGPIAARYTKEAIARANDGTLADGMRIEADLSILLHTTMDRTEGIQSFLERRPPRFRGT